VARQQRVLVGTGWVTAPIQPGSSSIGVPCSTVSTNARRTGEATSDTGRELTDVPARLGPDRRVITA
jgi:hypothetical protein